MELTKSHSPSPTLHANKSTSEDDPFAIAAKVLTSFGWACELYKDALGASSQGHEIMAKFVDPTTVVFVRGKNDKHCLGDVTRRQLVIMATVTVGMSRGQTYMPVFAEFPKDPSPAAIALEIVRCMARAMEAVPHIKAMGADIFNRLPQEAPKQLTQGQEPCEQPHH